MANRNLQQKRLKNRRKGRYAKFSGATTRFAGSAFIERIEQEGEDKVRVKKIEVYVGPVSFSKQVINGTPVNGVLKRSDPAKNHVARQEYFERLNSYDVDLPQTLGLSEPMKELMKKYDEVLRETPKEMYITLVNNTTGRLDLYFCGQQFFFVDVDYKKRIIRRSRVYHSKYFAMKMLEHKSIVWVEHVSSPKIAKIPDMSAG